MRTPLGLYLNWRKVFFYKSLYFLRSTSIIQNWNTLNVRFIIQNCAHIKLHHRLEFRGLKESGTYKPVVIVCEVRTRSCPCLSFEGFFFISSATWKFLLLRCVAFLLLNSLSFTIFKVPFEIFFALFKNRGFCPVLKSALVNLNKLCLLVLFTICTEKRSSDSLIFDLFLFFQTLPPVYKVTH